MSRPLLVSACLLGLATRYDGSAKRNPTVLDLLSRQGWQPIPACPEQLAGLPTPRPRCAFTQGDGHAVLDRWGEVRNEAGEVVNAPLLRGAVETLKLIRLCGCPAALLKEGSPSCGVTRIDRNGERVAGQGVTAALLAREGVALFSEEQLPQHSAPATDDETTS